MPDNDTHETLLARWLSGELTEAELQALEADPDFATLKRAAEESAQLTPPPFDANASWEALMAQTDIEETQPETKEPETSAPVMEANIPGAETQAPIAETSGPAAEPAPEAPVLRPNFMRQHGWKVLALAASVTLLLVFVLRDPGPAMTRIMAKAGAPQSVKLPDGSEVRLNAGSSIEYAAADWEANRKVLLEGEAFFEVAKGARFEVRTELGSVEVLGTSFNVRAHDARLDVTCYTGKVRVRDVRDQEVGLLTPGQGLVHTQQETMPMRSIPADGPGWLRGDYRFKAVPYPEVIAEVERQFDVSINFPKSMRDKEFSGGFTTKSLKTALDAITIPYGLTSEDKGKGKIRLY